MLTQATDNQGNDTRRGVGFIILNLIGQCGPFLGTTVYPTSGAPYYLEGQSVCAAFMFFTAVLALGLRTLLVRENRKLDVQYGTLEQQRSRAAVGGGGGQVVDGVVTGQEKVEAAAGVENYGPLYRYVL